ncbi:MAG: SDR family oxidoreductase [Candidatus Omnitrophota bacterium]|nr:MAG: SDR family oxidoreductase [Candidatus Omnitrophota bacterium]
MDLKGKNVIVTGGANGIGRSLAEALVHEGAQVGVLDIDAGSLAKLQKEVEGIYCVCCDVSDSKKAKEATEEIYKHFKTIDVLVNNAAIIHSSPLVSLVPGAIKTHDVKMWDKVISTNLSSVFYVSLPVIEKMILHRTRGVIINIGSIGAAGNPGQSAYSAAKAAISTLTVVWAKELGPLGIRVVCVAPGFTKTETTLNAMQENVLKEWVRKVPLRRLGEVNEIVDCILFAIKNEFVNGKTLGIDGGLTL